MSENPFEIVELTDRGRGFSPISPPANFPSGNAVDLLVEIEQLFKPRNPGRDNSYVAAVRRLALYGAGTIDLDSAAFAALSEVADEYAEIMRAPDHGHASNASMARFVVERATERAIRDNLKAG